LSGKIGVGIIGCGAIGGVHAENFFKQQNSRLVAVADVLEERSRELATRFGVEAYADYRQLLRREDIQAVAICLPHNLHAQVTVEAARAGKHILCEKPIATNLKDADQMIAAAHDAGVKLGIVYNLRFDEVIQKSRKALDESKLGKLIAGDVLVKNFRSDDYYTGWRTKWDTQGGGVVITQAIHWIDIFQWFFGPVDSLYGIIDTLTHNIEVEDVAASVIRFKNGAIGSFFASTSTYPGSPTRMDIHGSNGTITIESTDKATVMTRDGRHETWVPSTKYRPVMVPPFVPVEGHEPCIKDFISAIAEAREPAVTGEEGRKSLEITLAVYDSAKSRRAVEFPLKE